MSGPHRRPGRQPGRRLGRRAADDAGASLILALAFTTFLGLVVASLLTYSATSLRSTNSTEAKALSTYDVDGALQAGVNQIRTDAPVFINAAGQPCPTLRFPGQPGGPNTAAPVAVTCMGGKGTGAVGATVKIDGNNRPRNALLTLGAGAEIGIDKGSNNVLRVRGNVYVNSTGTSIAQSGSACAETSLPPLDGTACAGMWVENGKLTAKGSCQGTVVAVLKSCDDPLPDPAGLDPAYPQPAGTLDYRPVPPCGAAPTVTFVPGYYDDAVALSGLTNGTGCKGKTLHFTPGVYYFDFHNGEGGPLPTGPRVWTINDAATEVVGGRARGWTPAGGNPSIPGACVSPLDSATNGGVQFVFGGDSRLDLRAGRVELCGRYSLGQPPIALYGAKTGADVVTGPVTAKTDGTGTSTGPSFASPGNITEVDSVPATAVLDGTAGAVTSEVTLNGFRPPTVPAGSILTAARLVVRHRDNNAAGSKLAALRVGVVPNRVGAASTTYPVTTFTDGPTGAAYHAETIDVTDDLSAEAHRHGLAGLRVKYAASVAAGNRVTEHLDSIQLVLTWKPPAVRGQLTPVNGANCVGKAGAGGCAMITTAGPQTKFYVQGTTYAPRARLDVRLTNASAQVFRVGIIVRSLKIHITASVTPGPSPMIDLPDVAPAGVSTPLEVYFRAYTCPAGRSAACAANPAPAAPWRLSGTARARYESLALPTSGYRKVTVLSWTLRQT